MAAVASIAVWRPRPGRLQDLLAACARAKKIHQRLGAGVRVWQSQFGGEAFTIGYVTEHAEWKKFGEFAAKLEADGEWMSMVAEWTSARDPIADLVSNQVVVEAPVG